MKHPLRIAAAFASLLVLGGGALLLWASSGPLSNTELVQQKTYAASPASADRDTFTVMTYNLGHLAGPGSESPAPTSDSLLAQHMNETVDLIQGANPDVVGLQSVGFGGARSGQMAQLDTIATRLNFAAAGHAIGQNDRYLSRLRTSSVASGQAILSRFPLRRHLRRELSSSRPFWKDWFSPQSLVEVTAVDIGGWPLVVMNVHLRASEVRVREEQARLVNQLYDRLAQYGFPILLLGSFNSVMPAAPPTPSNDDTMKLLLKGTDLQPALSSEGARLMGRAVATYPTPDPTHKVDYIFYRPERIFPVETDILCGDASPPSRHCAVAMSFLLPRPKEELPDTPIPDNELPSLDSLMGS